MAARIPSTPEGGAFTAPGDEGEIVSNNRGALVTALGRILLVAIPLLLVAACGGSSNSSSKAAVPTAPRPTATPRPVATITISDNAFTPSTLTVDAGTKVVWTWTGNNPHSVRIAGEDSGQKTGSGTFEKVFDSPGVTYPYQCGVHGAAMAGTITVK
jgi:plastocyanin